MEYVFNNIKYVIVKDDKRIFDYNECNIMITDYFNDFDYILGDMSYNKIRLKGFCEKNNKIFRKINDIALLNDYISNYCADGCSYFLLKKVK